VRLWGEDSVVAFWGFLGRWGRRTFFLGAFELLETLLELNDVEAVVVVEVVDLEGS
jgi:hypothetical protein